jgi:hypothetical protein
MGNNADQIMRKVIDGLNRATPRQALTQAVIKAALQTREGWLRCSVQAFEEWMREPERRARLAAIAAEKAARKRKCQARGAMNRKIISTKDWPERVYGGFVHPRVEFMYHATKGWRQRTDGFVREARQ